MVGGGIPFLVAGHSNLYRKSGGLGKKGRRRRGGEAVNQKFRVWSMGAGVNAAV